MLASRVVVLCSCLFLTSVDRLEAQSDCSLDEITSDFLRIRLENLLIAQGGEDSDLNFITLEPNGIQYTCLAQGSREGRYRELSVILTYTKNSDGPMANQFELDCTIVGWQERFGSLSDDLVSTLPSYVNISSLTNCSRCDENAGSDNNCKACDEACDIGLMRCTGPTDEDCCVAFNPAANKMCSPNFDFQCDSQPCANNGTCVPEIDGYNCACAEGFTGVNCTINIDDCADNPCKNGNTCIDGVDEYICICVEGITGLNCDVDIDDCANNPCKNGSTCLDGVNDYLCICAEGFTGFNCDVDIDDCADNPCKNSSTCIDVINNYRCICVNGFTGINCDININDCASNPCLNNSTCIDLVGDYNCVCAEGFTGEKCATVINECDNKPCKFNSTCVSEFLGYNCICSSGYTGRDCDIDIDECSNNPCSNGGTCINTSPGFTCMCPLDYTGVKCETTFIILYEKCAEMCPQTTLFERNLCVFYCQLKEWRKIANENGLNLPEIGNDDESSSDHDRWAAAVSEQERFSELWTTMNTERLNAGLIKEDQSPPMSGNTISQWKFHISEHKDYLGYWRDYIRSIHSDPPLSFNDIPVCNIEQDASQEELSEIFSNYNQVWSNDVSSYVSEFDSED